jgi:hypothetical protein
MASPCVDIVLTLFHLGDALVSGGLFSIGKSLWLSLFQQRVRDNIFEVLFFSMHFVFREIRREKNIQKTSNRHDTFTQI